VVHFIIADIGQQPAKIITESGGSNVNKPGIKDYNIITKGAVKIIRKMNVYVTNAAPQAIGNIIDVNYSNYTIERIRSGEYSIYMYGEFTYINLANSKKSIYKYAAELNLKNGIAYYMIKNDNIPIK